MLTYSLRHEAISFLGFLGSESSDQVIKLVIHGKWLELGTHKRNRPATSELVEHSKNIANIEYISKIPKLLLHTILKRS